MESNSRLKLFISYSHLDGEHIKSFEKQLAPLKDSDLIEAWYDRKILAGDDYQNTIDNNLENADIICLCISANFLDSSACKKEKKKALELSIKKNIQIIPIILSHCGWLDDKELCTRLALPTDGKPVSSFKDPSEAWHDVYNGIKNILLAENAIRNLNINDEFKLFLQDTELLAKAHSQKEKVLLDDIFIFPNLIKYDELQEFEKKINSEKIIEEFSAYSKIMISGEDQSGKTFLCKKIYCELRSKNFIPIYLSMKYSEFQENAVSILNKGFHEQFSNALDITDSYITRKVVPIVDDFHLIKNKEKFLKELEKYKNIIVIVDSIFALNFKNENINKSFNLFKITELNPWLRYELIKKWVNLSDRLNNLEQLPNNIYKTIDEKTELIDHTLGKIISSGIMPAYPFVILSVISYYETFERPLEQEITSQGYCYQALIFLYLRKQGVKNDEIDTYMNFLTEISYYFFDKKTQSLPESDFLEFQKLYLDKFILPVELDILLKKLNESRIFGLDNLNNYRFYYAYIYYYFIAKYLAEHLELCKSTISNLIQNLHKNENAYIVIFVIHHSKNSTILDEIIGAATNLFKNHEAITLVKDELTFFDKQIENLMKEILPPLNTTPEEVRKKQLETQELIENNRDKTEEQNETNEATELAKELRRGVRTVEVMGRILKNRAGSLEKDKLKFIFQEAMFVHLRILASFLKLISDEKEQVSIIRFIQKRLEIISEKISKEKGRKPGKDTLDKLARIIFWNTNYNVIYGFILKIIHSLGSDKLYSVVDEVCIKVNTPVSFLVKHGILMWYNKNLQIDRIAGEIESARYSELSRKIIRRLIVRHASMHVIDYKERQRIETKLHVPSEKLLLEKIKSEKAS